MSIREIHDRKGFAREMTLQERTCAHTEVSAGPPQRDTTCCTSLKKREDIFEPTSEDGFDELINRSLLPVTRADAAILIRAWQQLAGIAIRQAPRIAFKVKGRILFLEL